MPIFTYSTDLLATQCTDVSGVTTCLFSDSFTDFLLVFQIFFVLFVSIYFIKFILNLISPSNKRI